MIQKNQIEKQQQKDQPGLKELIAIFSGLTLLFVNLGDLTVISSFASSTFLLIFVSINFSAFRLRKKIVIGVLPCLSGILLCFVSWLVLCGYLWQHNRRSLIWIEVFYLGTVILEFLFSERRIFIRKR